MRILITAGNIQSLLERLRCIKNIFSGKPGTGVAFEDHRRGYQVNLLASQPELATDRESPCAGELHVKSYRTFEQLQKHTSNVVIHGSIDAIVDCAAVSDFKIDGEFTTLPKATFDRANHS